MTTAWQGATIVGLILLFHEARKQKSVLLSAAIELKHRKVDPTEQLTPEGSCGMKVCEVTDLGLSGFLAGWP